MIAVTTLELTIRMVVALVVILGLLALCNFTLRRFFGLKGTQQAAIQVRYQQRLDKHASVHLVEAGGRLVLVGTTTGSIVVLAEGDDLIAEPPQDDTERIDLRSANPVRLLQNKTVRR